MDDKVAATVALDSMVKEYLYDLLDDSTRKLYSTVALNLLNAEDGVWNRIFSGIHPSAPEMLPDISVYAHNALLDWRPKKMTPDTLAAFRSCTKESTTDDVLFKIQEQSLAKPMRLVFPAFEMILCLTSQTSFPVVCPRRLRQNLPHRNGCYSASQHTPSLYILTLYGNDDWLCSPLSV